MPARELEEWRIVLHGTPESSAADYLPTGQDTTNPDLIFETIERWLGAGGG